MFGFYLREVMAILRILPSYGRKLPLSRAISCRNWAFFAWWLDAVESIFAGSTSHYTGCGLNCCITECYVACSVSIHTTLTLHHITLFAIGLLGNQSSINRIPECSVVSCACSVNLDITLLKTSV